MLVFSGTTFFFGTTFFEGHDFFCSTLQVTADLSQFHLIRKFNMVATGCLKCRFLLFLLLISFSTCTGVLPTYTPPLNVERVDLIERYFQLGLGYSEILLFLESLHDCFLSLRQLKWMLKQEGLARLLSTILFDELRWPCAPCHYNNIGQRWPVPVLVLPKKSGAEKMVVPPKNWVVPKTTSRGEKQVMLKKSRAEKTIRARENWRREKETWW